MKLINKSNNKILADNLKIADNFFKRLIGLLGRKALDKGEGLHIIPCTSIHSFFMKFRFDAIFLNKNNEVVYLIQNMPAWHVSKICFSGYSVVELPPDVIKDTETSVGDVLEFLEQLGCSP
ncbi:MAG TPA: DUF192 domain-containing protein [Cyanobacteria bacterium UBA9971]|nr:DUF192 domain-containing protein [Cyanobacteria bacterium UBA9971]